MNLKELKSKANLLRPIVRIGKDGIDENLITEIKKHLKKRKLIKIKMLKSFRDEKTKDVAKEIAEKTDSELISSVGFVFVLYRES